MRFLFLSILSVTIWNISIGQGLITKPHEDVYVIVEQMPVYPHNECLAITSQKKRSSCGQTAFSNFVNNNINYPNNAIKNKTEGLVVVQFVIGSNGKIKDPKILKEIGDGCGAEVIRVIKNSTPWIPGVQNGEAVNVQFNLPVRFDLTNINN